MHEGKSEEHSRSGRSEEFVRIDSILESEKSEKGTRMRILFRWGGIYCPQMTTNQIAEELDIEVDEVERIVDEFVDKFNKIYPPKE